MTPSITDKPADGFLTTVERIADLRGFDGLRQEWNELLESSDSDCIFLTWEWLHTWWKHLGGDRQLAIIAVRSGGRLVALAAVCRRPGSLLGRRPLGVIEFLGTGWVGSDYLDFIVRKGCESEARHALLPVLANEGVVFDWKQLRWRECAAAWVATGLEERGWTVKEAVTNTCPLIRLEGMSWEGYLATLGAEHRYNFNRKWKRLNRDFSVQFVQVQHPEQCRESLELAIELHNRRWRDRGFSEAFHTAGLVAFHQEFSQIALERGWLRLYVLRLDDKPAACLYGFLYRGTFYFYQSGFDPVYLKQSVGMISMGLAIRNAIEEGAKEYDLLHGGEEYKSHWSSESRQLGRLELYPPGSAGRICRRVTELERASRRTVRRVLGAFQ